MRGLSRPLVALGAVLLALGTATPVVAGRRIACGWTCYSPLRGASLEQVGSAEAANLWHLRPALAVLVVVAAVVAVAAAALRRGHRLAALLVVAAVALVVVDALTVDGLDLLVVGDVSRDPSPSPWALVPALGGVLAAAALLGRAGPRTAGSSPASP